MIGNRKLVRLGPISECRMLWNGYLLRVSHNRKGCLSKSGMVSTSTRSTFRLVMSNLSTETIHTELGFKLTHRQASTGPPPLAPEVFLKRVRPQSYDSAQCRSRAFEPEFHHSADVTVHVKTPSSLSLAVGNRIWSIQGCHRHG
jgi:hypothetical protein